MDHNDCKYDIEAIKKRGKYVVISPSHKLLVAKEAARIGVNATINNLPRLNLKYSSLSYWSNKYKKAKDDLGTSVYLLYMYQCVSIILSTT